MTLTVRTSVVWCGVVWCCIRQGTLRYGYEDKDDFIARLETLHMAKLALIG